jgi:hypothetical protein
MSIKEAKIIIDEYGLSNDENTIEIVLEAINKFGSARNVIIEGLKPEYKYLKRLSKLLSMLDVKPSFDEDAEEIAKLMHSIYKVVSNDSREKGEDFLTLLSRINVRKTFNPTQMQLWVMNHIGGRKLIAKINYEDPNALNRKIVDAIHKYENVIQSPNNLQIENQTIKSIY